MVAEVEPQNVIARSSFEIRSEKDLERGFPDEIRTPKGAKLPNPRCSGSIDFDGPVLISV